MSRMVLWTFYTVYFLYCNELMRFIRHDSHTHTWPNTERGREGGREREKLRKRRRC